MHSLGDRVFLFIAVALLFVSICAHGGRFSEKLDLFTHLAPFLISASAVVLIYGLFLATPSQKVWIAPLSLAAALASLLLILPEYARPSPGSTGSKVNLIKIIQLNAWKDNVDVKATADWLDTERPDIITIDEVRPPITAELVHRGFHFKAGIAHTAIFSRLSSSKPSVVIPRNEWPRLPGFARATLEASSPAGETIPIEIFAVHLPWPTDPSERLERASLLRLVHLYAPDDVIVAGDFNLTPWSFALQSLDRQMGLTRRDKALFSWPARFDPKYLTSWPIAFLPIDHIYAGPNWRTVRITRGPRVGSDHYPIVAVFAYKPLDRAQSSR